MPAHRKDITGVRYGRLVAMYDTGKSLYGSRLWLCQCDCGKTKEYSVSRLSKGDVVSCGCRLAEIVPPPAITHGLSKTRLYHIWEGIKQRCTNKNEKHWDRYGGRGITLCKEWYEFMPFHDWAFANGYDENAPVHACTIDRIDNDKGYSPDNCRWVTSKQNTRNRAITIKQTINGKVYTIPEIAEVFGINENTIRYRYHAGYRGEQLIGGLYDTLRNKRNRSE